ncbi:ROK family protein [Sediminibacillus massiliensis]|uniref:ROK family protein n=1 Tax=Sediminibacillus massiliensis TaxID=1926277 RepID=UPI0009885B77|nr:ROK family protein [Sediminibacillus massiliensis]
MKRYLAFDIGGTYIKYGIVNDKAEIMESEKVKTPKTLNELLDCIEQIAKRYHGIAGIAVSSPGAVSSEGVIHGSSALPFIHGPNIKKLIAERTGLSVYLENDANCAGYAELWNGSAKGKKDVLVMVIGTGIGGSVIKDGLLHKGGNLHGGEFGYMLINSDFVENDGVWSRVASTAALVRNVAAKKDVDPESLTGEEIFAMADDGDSDCQEAIDQFYRLLALGIYNLQYIYDPEIILIGGGVSARSDLIDKINDKLDWILENVTLAKIKPNIAACKFRQNANLLGAVYGFQKENNIV